MSIFILGTATQCEICSHKEQSSVKVTARFVSLKLLMYVKVSVAILIHNVVDVFPFPIREVSKTSDTHEILKCFAYLFHTDTDSCSQQILIVCNKSCSISKQKAEELILVIFLLFKTGRPSRYLAHFFR